MVQWRTAGWTWYQIARQLNREGVPTKTSGQSWRPSFVQRLLTSRTVTDWLNLREVADADD